MLIIIAIILTGTFNLETGTLDYEITCRDPIARTRQGGHEWRASWFVFLFFSLHNIG